MSVSSTITFNCHRIFASSSSIPWYQISKHLPKLLIPNFRPANLFLEDGQTTF